MDKGEGREGAVDIRKGVIKGALPVEAEEEEDRSSSRPFCWFWPVDADWDGGRMVNDTGVLIVEEVMTQELKSKSLW